MTTEYYSSVIWLLTRDGVSTPNTHTYKRHLSETCSNRTVMSVIRSSRHGAISRSRVPTRHLFGFSACLNQQSLFHCELRRRRERNKLTSSCSTEIDVPYGKTPFLSTCKIRASFVWQWLLLLRGQLTPYIISQLNTWLKEIEVCVVSSSGWMISTILVQWNFKFNRKHVIQLWTKFTPKNMTCVYEFADLNAAPVVYQELNAIVANVPVILIRS